MRLIKNFSLGMGALIISSVIGFYTHFQQQLDTFSKREVPSILQQQQLILGMTYTKIPEIKSMIHYPETFGLYEQCWKPERQALANRVIPSLSMAKYHLRRKFDNEKAMPKMFKYLRD